jgi:hypothetical protein
LGDGCSSYTALEILRKNISTATPSQPLSSAKKGLTAQIYKSLDSKRREIRLIVIESSYSWHSSIKCNLRVVSLSNNPRYEALSYVWGDAKDTLPISLARKEFMVTRNLEHGLRLLRSRGIEFAWVDAICIDQDNLEERKEQVGIMSDNYSKATNVVVWLGSDDDEVLDGFHADMTAYVNPHQNSTTRQDFGNVHEMPVQHPCTDKTEFEMIPALGSSAAMLVFDTFQSIAT